MRAAHALALPALFFASGALAQNGFEVAARAAYQVPFGERAGVTLSDSLDIRPGFQLEVGGRLRRGQVSLLGFAAFGPGTERPPPGRPVEASALTPAHVWRFGAQVLWRPTTVEFFEPWGGLALGVELFQRDVGLFFTPQVGFDFRIYSFRFGPYFEVPMGVFLRTIPSGSEFHGWITVGLKLALVLG